MRIVLIVHHILNQCKTTFQHILINLLILAVIKLTCIVRDESEVVIAFIDCMGGTLCYQRRPLAWLCRIHQHRRSVGLEQEMHLISELLFITRIIRSSKEYENIIIK